MASEDKQPIYTRLKLFYNKEVDDFANQNFDGKKLITASSPAELEVKSQEFQQQFWIQRQFKSVAKDIDEKSIYANSLRLPSYMDYELMESYPLLGAALNLLGEESTTIGDNGKMLSIYSDDKDVKRELEHLFYNVLDVNANLYYWVRILCKFGDNFLYLKTMREKGIVGVQQLPLYEIEREEKWDILKDKQQLRYLWRMKGIEFADWQVSHFRLLGNDKMLPYGTSVLAPIRVYYRLIRMLEDAMIVYRVSRAAERRVIKVNTGNLDPSDIQAYVKKVAQQFKRSPLVHPDGSLNYKFNPATIENDIFMAVKTDNATSPIEILPGACLALDTEIELLDGRSLSLREIINEHEAGKELWTYSINPESGEIVPGLISWAGVTRKDTEVLRVTLDNGESFVVTPDHKFPTRFNGVKEAKDLQIGESMWSFSKRYKPIRESRNTYEQIFDHKSNKWVYTHRVVAS